MILKEYIDYGLACFRNNSFYLQLMLDNFFRAVRKLELEIEKIRMQECEQHV